MRSWGCGHDEALSPAQIEAITDEIACTLADQVWHMDPYPADRAREILTTYLTARLVEITATNEELLIETALGRDEADRMAADSALSQLHHEAKPLVEAMELLHPDPDDRGDSEW